MLTVDKISAGYGMVQILWDVSFKIKEKEIVSIIGPNGAGKTTLVKTIMGLLPTKNGTIQFKGENIENLQPYDIVKKGLSLIPEGREIFPKMTVEENILLGAYTEKEKQQVRTIRLLKKIPQPKIEEGSLQMQVTSLDYNDYVKTNKTFLRPSEVDLLMADPSKAKREMG